jgi:hypothetical protein
MIVCPCLIKLLHFALYALLDLGSFLVELSLQEFGTVFHKDVATHEVELASMSYLDNSQTLLDVSLIITPLLEAVLVLLAAFGLLYCR